MNILQMIFSIEKGGAETYLYNLLDNGREDTDFFVICNHRGSNHEKIVDKCRDVEIISMKNVFDIKAAKKVANYCREKDIEIIQTHFLRENYIGVLSKLFNPAVKIVWTAHLIAENRAVIRFFNRLFSKFVDRIICVSKAVEASLIREGISPNKTQVIYNGVDTGYFKPMNDKGLREELSIDKDMLILTTTSRFNKEKGYDFLIEGLRELKAYTTNFRALLVGEGEEREHIRELIRTCDLESQVDLLGYRDDIPQILAITDIYVSPSKNEAISFSIMEALACGVPVIATEVGGVPEIFEGKQCGILVPFMDAKGFAKAINDLYNDKGQYALFKSNCRNEIIKGFSHINMLEKTYNLYGSL